MKLSPLLNPNSEENSKHSENAIFQEYDHESFLKSHTLNENKDADDRYKRLTELQVSWNCPARFVFVVLCFVILLIVIAMLVYNRVI